MNFYFRPKDHITVLILLAVVVGFLGFRLFTRNNVQLNQAQPAGYDFRLDVNVVSRSELTLLPGIGDKLAGRIVDFRDSRGSLTNLDELMQVNGIGQGKLDAIRSYLRANPGSFSSQQ